MKTTEVLKTAVTDGDVATVVSSYSKRFDEESSHTAERIKQAAELNKEFYSLATDFYLHGWGKMFHFGVRRRGEAFMDSLLRHETYLSDQLQLKAGERCLDVGCGVGGPMMNLAKKTNAHITGINNSDYQISKGKQFVKDAGLDQNCSFMECNWMEIPLESGTFDKAYEIEATCHAADQRVKVFSEISRLLKQGGLFGGYEWVMNGQYDPANREHQRIKREIEIANGISNLNLTGDVIKALQDAGFEVLECRDVAADCDPETPWYLPLKGEGLSLTALRISPIGRWMMSTVLRVLEAVRIVPKGTVQVSDLLNVGADALVKGGEEGVFTPMLFFLARKR